MSKKRKRVFTGSNTPITIRSAPDPNSPMGRVTAEDGSRVRAYPYLLAFVRPYVPGEFEQHQVVSPERMEVVTHVLVARIDLTTVARTRLPITTEQAEMFQAFGVLDRAELQAADTSYGPFSLPEETQRFTIASASSGIQASLQDYPRNKIDQAVLEVRAKQACGTESAAHTRHLKRSGHVCSSFRPSVCLRLSAWAHYVTRDQPL